MSCLNPFRAGRCLSTLKLVLLRRLLMSQSLSSRAMSFDVYKCDRCDGSTWSQSLSSRAMSFDVTQWNEEEQASMSQSLSSRAMSFDIKHWKKRILRYWSQSLSSRAMSFDELLQVMLPSNLSQSLSSRAMSFDCSGMLEAGIMRPFRPTSQFFWKVKELALDLSK